MTTEEKQEILGVIGPFLEYEDVRRMKEYIQHGNVTTYRHVVNVVKLSYIIDEKLGKKADREALLTAALLHDFYGYDWHEKPLSDLHGYRHPHRAAERAREVFGVDDRVHTAIETHMWPFTLTKIPRSREGWILCMADKLASLSETLWMRGE
ncbi:MAG: HD domain-containing protein [Eubacterium sp.]|nr:HD domain-containing protein [Eubacterium sp.]